MKILETDIGLVLSPAEPDSEYFKWSYKNEGSKKLGKELKEADNAMSNLLIGEENEERLINEVQNRINGLMVKAENLVTVAGEIKRKKKSNLIIED